MVRALHGGYRVGNLVEHDMIYTRHMDDEELERLYYQAGLVEIAAVYAQLVDVQVENDEYQTEIESMVTAKDYAQLETERDDLAAKVEKMDAAMDAAYRYVDDTAKPSKRKILKLLEVEA